MGLALSVGIAFEDDGPALESVEGIGLTLKDDDKSASPPFITMIRNDA